MEDRRPVWIWSNARQIAPHQLRVYPLTAIGASAIGGAFVFLAAFAILAAIPPASLKASPPHIALASLKTLAWACTKGHLFPVQAPQLLAAMSGWAVILKALLALSLATMASLKIWKTAIAPRDGHEHIRGTKVYHGDDAKRVLMRELKQGKK
ncbi:hypothetical protein [Massilia sp. NP310]|uniref:hypothetical protein n=1 Tax=Massilia sp. NP310 TaxID=2861282 RepID=UPI001C633402|nr:hypothetical protein [Massilia sp. NP310]QYG02237.1 hypothetical protein KY496_01970 [Massilia sp. NP310]